MCTRVHAPGMDRTAVLVKAERRCETCLPKIGSGAGGGSGSASFGATVVYRLNWSGLQSPLGGALLMYVPCGIGKINTL